MRGKLEDGQLSNSPLTLRDIDGICEAFAKVLNGVFHERIEYPSTPVPKRDPFFLNQREEEQRAAAEHHEAKTTGRMPRRRRRPRKPRLPLPMRPRGKPSHNLRRKSKPMRNPRQRR